MATVFDVLVLVTEKFCVWHSWVDRHRKLCNAWQTVLPYNDPRLTLLQELISHCTWTLWRNKLQTWLVFPVTAMPVCAHIDALPILGRNILSKTFPICSKHFGMTFGMIKQLNSWWNALLSPIKGVVLDRLNTWRWIKLTTTLCIDVTSHCVMQCLIIQELGHTTEQNVV